MSRLVVAVGLAAIAAIAVAVTGCPQPDAVPARPTGSSSSSGAGGGGAGGGSACAPCFEWAHLFPGHGQLYATDLVLAGDDVILAGAYIGKAPFSNVTQGKPTIFFTRMTEETIDASAVFPTGTKDTSLPTVVTQLALAPGGDALYAVGAFKDSFALVDAGEITGDGQGFVAALDPKTLARQWGHALATPGLGNGQTPQSYTTAIATRGTAQSPELAIIAQVVNASFDAGSDHVVASYWSSLVAPLDPANGQGLAVTKLDEQQSSTLEWRLAAGPNKFYAAGLGDTYFAAVVDPTTAAERRASVPSPLDVPADVATVPGSADFVIGGSIHVGSNQHRLSLIRMSPDTSFTSTFQSASTSALQIFTRVRFEPNGRLLGLGIFVGTIDFGGHAGKITATDMNLGDVFLVEFASDLATANWALDLGAATSDFNYGGIAVTPDNRYAYVATSFTGDLAFDGRQIPAHRANDSALIKLRLE